MKQIYRILFALMVFAWGIPSTTHANIWGYVTMNVGDTKRLNASESTISTLRMIGEYNIESYEWYSDDWACVQVTGYEWWCCDIKALRPCEGVTVTFKCKYRGAGGWTESMTHCYVIDVRENSEPTSISLSSTSISLQVGGTKQLSASVLPSNAPQGVSWSVVSGSSYVSVSSSGLVTAKAAGTATVRATSTEKSSVYADCTVRVTEPEPEPDPVPGTWSGNTLTIGGAATNSSNVVPYNNYYRYSTTQMLYTPVEIGKSGTISGIAFKVANSTSFATSEVKVYLGHKSGKFSSESNYVRTSGLTLVYSGTPTLGQATGWETLTFNQNTFTYNGTDNLVVVVTKKASDYTNSLTYSFYTGTGYTLYRRSDDTAGYGDASNTSYSYTASTARPAVRLEFGKSPTGISLPESETVKEGSTITLTPTITPSDATTTLTWKSSDTNIATVTSAGVVKGIKAGTATITVTTSNGKSASCTITVTPISPIIQFADAKVKALCVANWDTNGDGKLSEAEAAAITDLGEVFKENIGITSFNELQHFTGLTSIGEYAFYHCYALKSISFPDNVKKIDDFAFDGCPLVSIIIPENVTSIGYNPFGDCNKLVSIVVDENNEHYDSRNNCNAIIRTETNNLISGCQNTVIPGNVTSIGRDAFSGCRGLKSINIPDGVTSIGAYAFKDCSALTSIDIPNGVAEITVETFDGCINLTSVTLPESVTSIAFAFADCWNLTSITIPENVTEIGFFSFLRCRRLTSVIIPNSVNRIGWAAFKGCSDLTSVTIGSSVTSIGSNAFEDCSSLTDVYCYAESVPNTSSDAFNNSPITSATLHVPAGSVEAYKTTEPWSDFGSIVAIEDVTLGDLTGDGKVSITDIVMIVDVIAGDITDANQVAAADVNGDGKVSITDCSAAVDLIAAGTSTPSSARKKANAMLSDNDFISGTLHDGLLSIDLEAEHRFTAFQMTVSVPEGMTLGNGSMNAQRGADHLLTVRNLGGGRYLVAGFSADNDELTAGNGCLLTLATEGQADADIVISDIEFATTQAEAYYLADAAVSSTPTGINEMKNEELKIKNEVYDLQGRRVTKATKGIYIYNGKKTMIK